jgi:hypothetical protein
MPVPIDKDRYNQTIQEYEIIKDTNTRNISFTKMAKNRSISPVQGSGDGLFFIGEVLYTLHFLNLIKPFIYSFKNLHIYGYLWLNVDIFIHMN